MPLTINGTYTTDGYTLSGSSFGVLNPVTVTGSIDAGAASGPAALYAQGPDPWTIANLGTITGDGIDGIELAAGGDVVNGTSGFVSGKYGIISNGDGGVTNQAGGQISGRQGGVAVLGPGMLSNDGTIGGTSKAGVYLGSGMVTNQSLGSIDGGYGVVIKGSGGLYNAGRVSGGSATNQSGVYLDNGTVTNQSRGYLSGGWGLYIHGIGTVTNSGTIVGTSQGASFLGGGSVNNQGSMTGAWGVVIQGGQGTVDNGGVLRGTSQSGAYLSGGLVSNTNTGLISGASGVVIRNGPGTIVNAGAIAATSASGYSVYLAPGFAGLVSVQPGAVFEGLVSGGNTVGATSVSMMEFESGTSAGSLSGIGTQFVDFAGTTIDAGARWTWTGGDTLGAGTTLDVAGTLTLSNAIMNDGGTVTGGGTIIIDASTLSLTALAGSGQVVIGRASTLTTTGTVGAGETIAFSGGLGVLNLAFPTFSGTIEDFDATDTIDLPGVTDATSAGVVNGNTLLIQRAGNPAISLTLDPNENATGGLFAVTANGAVTSDLGRTLSWTDAAPGGAFNSAANWNDLTDGVNPALAAPNGSDTVEFNTSGGGVSGSGTVASVLVGSNGDGALQLSGGATLMAGTLDVGVLASDVGQVGLAGAGTDLTVFGSATVADDGTGVLSVLAGATFSAAGLTIGSQDDSSGALIVSGAGSETRLSGALNIGTALGTGDLTVGPGAAVHASVVNLQGQVVLEGGLLDPTVQLINQGQTAGGFGTIAADEIVDEGVIQAGGTKPSQKLLIVQGTVLGGGTLTVNGTLPGSATGILRINAGGTLEMTGAVLNAATTTFTDDLTPAGTYTVTDSKVDVTFADAAGVLTLDDIAQFAGTIATFQAGDAFVVTGGTLANLSVANGDTLTFSDSRSGVGEAGTDQIMFGSAIGASEFDIVNGDTIQVACFAAGTRIETDHGPVPVEALTVGDRVATEAGLFEPIAWIGQRAVRCDKHPTPETVWPVRVRAWAFGDNVPVCDLYLSPDHAVFVNGVLVPLKLLINGLSIVQVRWPSVVYFHVELSRHAVILAEGLPVESYLEVGDGADFGRDGVVRLHPNLGARWGRDTAMVWELRGAAPLIIAGSQLAAARAVVAEMARRPGAQFRRAACPVAATALAMTGGKGSKAT